jgi:rhodanese-related sulfurtransferase
LLERLQAGEVVVLEVRPEEEYRAGHLPGALFVPPGEVERRLASLPRDREIVAYCRGRYCVYAVEAVKVLRRHGFAARRMEQGIPEWRLLGFPVEVGVDRG